MAQRGSRRPARPPYDNPFFHLFLAARPRTALASHRAAFAGNRPAGAGTAPSRDSPSGTGDPARPAITEARRGGPSPADAAAPPWDDGGDLSIRHSRRL